MSEHVRQLRAALDASGSALDTAARWGRTLAAALSGGARGLVAGHAGRAAQAPPQTAE